jgi:hypothetical protein
MQMPLNTSFAELANGAFAVASLYTNLLPTPSLLSSLRSSLQLHVTVLWAFYSLHHAAAAPFV